MASLKDKIENALNETRILVLGIQILIGFAFRTFFEPGFARMSPLTQQVLLSSLGLMLIALVILLAPVSFRRIVLQGRNTGQFHRLATMTVTVGLLPFAVAMAAGFFLGVRWLSGAVVAGMCAAVLLAITLFFWYGLQLLAQRRRPGELRFHSIRDPLREINMHEEHKTDLTTRIKQVLIECRVVLPGAQALLGFQLIIMWMTAFYEIPQLWKLLHLASLTCVAFCTILLIMPAAYHRIVEQGEDSEMLHHVTQRALLMAMLFLGLGVCGDFYIVSRMTGLGTALSCALTLGLLAVFYGTWFGYAFWKKHHVADPAITRSRLKQPKAA